MADDSEEARRLDRSEGGMPQHDADVLCRSASAVYYAILQAHACRTGERATLPTLLCPRRNPPIPEDFSEATLYEAERFLLRLGMISDGRSGSADA